MEAGWYLQYIPSAQEQDSPAWPPCLQHSPGHSGSTEEAGEQLQVAVAEAGAQLSCARLLPRSSSIPGNAAALHSSSCWDGAGCTEE